MSEQLPFDHVDRPENHLFVPVKAQTGCQRCGYARGHHPTAAMLRIAVAASLFKPGGTKAGGTMKRQGKPCPRELAIHIEQLRAKLRAEYGCDYSFSIMGRGYVLAGSNAKDGEIEAIPAEERCVSGSTQR